MLTYSRLNVIVGALLAILVLLNFWFVIPVTLYVVLALLYFSAITIGSFWTSISFYLPVLSRAANRSSRQIAITFDDGPIPGRTDAILKILDKYETKAAFFCIGKRIENAPDLLKAIHLSGHTIGNHSYSHHKFFGFFSSKRVQGEIEETNRITRALIGKEPAFFRPPFGVTNPMIAEAVQKTGLMTVGWSNRSLDTVIKDPASLLKRVTSKLRHGDVVLFHDYCESTLTILPAFISEVRRLNFEIVSIDQLLNKKPYR